MTYYLLSNVNWEIGFDEKLSNEFIQNITTKNKITFIPTDFVNAKKTEYYVNHICNSFKQIGIIFNTYTTLSSEMTYNECINNIKSSDVILLTGGNTLAQMDFINVNHLIVPLCNFEGIIIGISAGSLNLCKTVVLLDEHPTKSVYVYDGIGVVNLSVDVHYSFEDKRKNALVQQALNTVNKLYCIPDYSFIKGVGKDIFLFGDIFQFQNELKDHNSRRL